MYFKMSSWLVLFILFYCANVVYLQGTGSGSNGNLRLCIVEGRGSYKRGKIHCPTLEKGNSNVECVIGVDRLDCLRRIHKGTVDFGVFSPEDLIAAQWADVDVLVSHNLRFRKRPFARSIVALINRRILTDEVVPVSALLRNTTLCNPAAYVDDLKPLSETLVRYLEILVTASQCDPKLSMTENRVKTDADYFGKACMAGDWVPYDSRDRELKRKYPSLCAACASKRCSTTDRYWGDSGALNCMADGVGDVTWAELDDVHTYFQNLSPDRFAFLCRDGSVQPVGSTAPCVWVQQPWNNIVAKRKAVEAVTSLISSLANSSVTDQDWHGALSALLELRRPDYIELITPPKTPMSYLSSAVGFREAYSQFGCNPPRHITICTTSLLANNKCSWLAEAGAVYGIAPPVQCARREGGAACMDAVRGGEADAVVGDADWIVEAKRNYSLTPILYEASPVIEKLTTISAFVRKDSGLVKMSDLRGKRAFFPRFEGVTWHSVLRYLTNTTKTPCKDVANSYFDSICAPGAEKHNISQNKINQLTDSCYKNGDQILKGEEQALRSLIEKKSDVAFLTRQMYNKYRAKALDEPWAKDLIELVPICPEENPKFCFLSWSNIGHVFVANNLTTMRHYEITNVLTKLDKLFGNHAHRLMFSMYGPYNHELDILFHNNTKDLNTDSMFTKRPYVNFPLNFELNVNSSDICQYSDYTSGFGAKMGPTILLVVILVFSSILTK